MTNKETIERNIGLTFDFVNLIIEKPEITDDLPDNFTLEFVEKDFAKSEKKPESKSDSGLKKKYIMVRNSFELTNLHSNVEDKSKKIKVEVRSKK
jgi:hypothetical protein